MSHSIASSFQSGTSRAIATARSSRAFSQRASKPLPLVHRGLAMLMALVLAVTAEAPKADRQRASA